ncbi:hypothetical protein COLO4_15339 [Corchorus olitorius]|uniref:Uncharacterized protein n=1 Tax=Corchorus olitorius TaxID=93759 RepID=A0A1R3JNB2_9ROSI|nr:hypothetical protein COLO4_15339 [Corchorus olitorius]
MDYGIESFSKTITPYSGAGGHLKLLSNNLGAILVEISPYGDQMKRSSQKD